MRPDLFGQSDQPHGDSTLYSTTFIVKELPSNTPHDASIFISGSFCDWYPDIEKNQLHENKSGNFEITIHHSFEQFDYKFTRGNWKSVEGRKNGRARPNRSYNHERNLGVIYVSIDSWEDISFGSYNLYMYILLLSALQGFLLIIAINSLGNQNKKANWVLSVLLFLITTALLGRASTFDPEIFNWQPKLILIPEIILFAYGPLFYYYIHKLLLLKTPGGKVYFLSFAPSVVQMFIYFPYLLLDNQTFIYRIIDQELFSIFAVSGVIALLYSSGFWVMSKRVIRRFELRGNLSESQNKYLRFLRGVIRIKAVYLVIWFSATLIYMIGGILEVSTLPISEKIIDVLWLLFSFIIFALAYFAVKHPEVLREKQRYKDQPMDQTEAQTVKQKLEDIMNTQKIFLDPELTLTNLANEIPTSSHTLSRIINEEYQQTFSGLINHFRLKEFIKRTKEDDTESFLARAYEVGFNSKTTFNRAFKKEFSTSPSVYFKKMLNK